MAQNAGSYEREFQNIADTPTTSNAFQREWIDYMLQHEYFSCASVRHLFVVIDPSSGKDGNYYAITSMIFVNGTCVVCQTILFTIIYINYILIIHACIQYDTH